MKKKLLFITLLFQLLHINAENNFFLSPDRWKAPIFFHTKFDEKYSSRFNLYENSGVSSSNFLERVCSTNNIYCADIINFEQTSDSIYISKVRICNGKNYELIFELLDHVSSMPEIKWVNEKLLFVRIWWGRILGTDFIIDIEERKIVYKEMVNDGWILFLQYQQGKDTSVIQNKIRDFDDMKEYLMLIDLANEQLSKVIKNTDDYKIIEIKNKLKSGLNLWKVTYKLKKILPIKENDIVGLGGEIFIEVDTKHKTSKLSGYGE